MFDTDNSLAEKYNLESKKFAKIIETFKKNYLN